MLPKEDTKKLLEKVMDFNKYVKANDLRSLLFAIYCFLIRECYKDKIVLKDEYNATKKYYKKIAKLFKKVIVLYLDGDIMSAMSEFEKIIVDSTTKEIVLSKHCMKKGTSLYRMRANSEYNLYDRKGMFHMPANLLSNLASSRYSMNGFSCLYLGASLYVCWEETRRPDIETVNYVKMVSTRDIELITTLCPNTFQTEQDVIQFFIFALCSKITTNDSDKFQFAYVFPEMLLHILVHHIGKNGEPYGIKYISSRYFNNDGNFSFEGLFYNYVIPICGDIDAKDHLCVALKKSFKVSEPKALYVNCVYGHNKIVSRSRPNEYVNTLFYKLEKDLNAKKKL